MNRARTFLSFVALLGLSISAGLAQSNISMVFLHNSPDRTINKLDLKVQQSGGDAVIIQDVVYQNVDDFTSVAIFGGLETTIEIYRDGGVSETSNDPSKLLLTKKITPTDYHSYALVLDGLVDSTGYVANPSGRSRKLVLNVLDIPTEGTDQLKMSTIVHHGSTDLEKVDAYIKAASPISLAAGLNFGDMSAKPVNVDRSPQAINLTKAGDRTKVIATFSANFTQLGNEVLLLVVSGFFSPKDNGDTTKELCLIAVTDGGNAIKLPLLVGSQTARVQIVHGSSDKQLNRMDVWVNTVKDPSLENFPYRTGRPFVEAPASIEVTYHIGPESSQGIKDSILSRKIAPLSPGRKYTIVAGGVGTNDTTYAKNPDGRDTRFDFYAYRDALDSAPAGKAVVRTIHMVTDAPKISVRSKDGSKVYADGLQYSDASASYSEFNPATDTLILAMRNIWDTTSSSDTVFADTGYVAKIESGKAYILLISGFLTPANPGAAGRPLTLTLIDQTGKATNVPRVAISGPVSVETENFDGLVVGPNPSNGIINVSWNNMADGLTASVIDLNGNRIYSGSLAQGTNVLDVQGAATGAYILTIQDAQGVVVSARMITIQ